MSKHLISVIVPVYNAEKTLRQCVESILRQEHKDFELLLIDDGSNDSSSKICDEYAETDNHIRVFHKKNGGVSSARNLGIENAQGDWITFVDSDDYITCDFFDAFQNCNEDLLIKQYIWLKNGKEYIDKRIAEYDLVDGNESMRVFLNKFLTTMILRGPCAKFYRKELLTDIRFNERMKVGEDACFVHEYLLKCKKFRCLHVGQYVVRLSSVGAEVKYNTPTQNAIESLSFLFNTYCQIEKSKQTNRGLFLSYLVYFKMISREDWKGTPSKWYRNKSIKKMYSYIWDCLSIKEKIKFKAIQFLSYFSFLSF